MCLSIASGVFDCTLHILLWKEVPNVPVYNRKPRNIFLLLTRGVEHSTSQLIVILVTSSSHITESSCYRPVQMQEGNVLQVPVQWPHHKGIIPLIHYWTRTSLHTDPTKQQCPPSLQKSPYREPTHLFRPHYTEPYPVCAMGSMPLAVTHKEWLLLLNLHIINIETVHQNTLVILTGSYLITYFPGRQ